MTYTPGDCPHCEYDRRFPGFEMGGWLQQDNNGPIVACPACNNAARHFPKIAPAPSRPPIDIESAISLARNALQEFNYGDAIEGPGEQWLGELGRVCEELIVLTLAINGANEKQEREYEPDLEGVGS